ncbi:MAG: LysR family transcriptional regulator [Prevotella sp.]|nr:LysR family transcriptional regulator [Prevotella sp.]
MDVNLNLYKYFLAVIEEENVSKAAEKLGVSQPTVSYNIHTLQRELQEELFVVGKSGVVPKRRALILYHRLEPLYHAFLQTIADFTAERQR